MTSLFARTTRRITLAHIRHVPTVPPRQASGLVAQVYRQVEEDFGLLAPPVALHAPAPAQLAAAWTILRETLIVEGMVSRAAKEIVAAAVSLANSCPYCVDVHGATLAGLNAGTDAAHVMADRIDAVADPSLRALARWARASGTAPSRGSPAPPPFPRAHEPELVGVATAFHYYNRMVNVFLPDSPLPPVSGRARMLARSAAAWKMGRLARVPARPGTSVDLLPTAPLPTDFWWAEGQPRIAAALSRAAAVFDAGGQRSVPAGARRMVGDLLPTGEPPAIGAGRWFDDTVNTLPAHERALGRLTLMVALASYRVTDAVVEAVNDPHDGRRVIEIAGWASFTAARRVGASLAAAR
ncbi:carboxymuconolactone decarboxylase family protein [Micromonospora sp. DT229]|uniref:carboxymuconolactone decarboxylase family protein n=1 Tax=Micromonospora sp. DT229 TaxID=3393430 RepID=UPI003CF7EF9F